MLNTENQRTEASGGTPVSRIPANEHNGQNTSSPRRAPAKRGDPRTAKGKMLVSRNATKHGLTSTSPVAGGESQEAWEEYYQRMREDLGPVGAAEEAVVHTLAAACWRRPRAMRREAQLMDFRRDEFEFSALDRWPREIEEVVLDGLGCRIGEAMALLECLEQLDHTIPLDNEEIINALYLPSVVCTAESLPGWLIFPREGDSWTPDDLERWICAFAEHLKTKPMELKRNAVTKGRGILDNKQKRRAYQERLELDTLFSRVSDLELVMRYEAHLDRVIDRALKELELLQRARAGEMAPLPERIEVTVN